MIVLTIIGILAAIAIPNYQWGIIKAREAVLREDLYNFRSTIDQYFADQGRYPDSLDDLKTKGYLRDIPKDPFTDSNQTWTTHPPPPPPPEATVQDIGSVWDVKSGSDKVGTNSIPYSDW
jgi:general secretion pathway protein G